MRLLMLSIRNLGRNLRRTVITATAIAFGMVMVHMMIGLQTGTYAEMIHQAVSGLAGHVVVQGQGYQERQDSDIVVHGVNDVVAQIHAVLPDAVVAPRLMLGGLLASPTTSVGIGLVGVDGATEATIQQLDHKVVEGTWLDGDGRGIVLGVDLARTLSVGLGDRVVYMGQHNGATEVSSRLFRVKGILRTGSAELDGFGAFGDLAAVQEAFGAPDVANRVTVHLGDPRLSDGAAAALRTAFASRTDLDVRTWREALPELYALIQLDKHSGDVMLTILGLIVAMGVLNTMLMSVLERTKEFGVMLAIGLTPGRLAGAILLEGASLGAIGAIAGLALGVAANWPLVHYGLDYSQFIGADTMESGGVTIAAVIHARYDPWRMAVYTAFAVVFTTLAAAYPAVYVARLRPVAAMRHV